MIRLPTDGDIRAAADWRLTGYSAQEIERGVARIVEAGGDLDSAAPTGDDHGAAGALPWPVVCALAVRAAGVLRDTSLFYRAGFIALNSQRQAERAAGKSNAGGDALHHLIVRHLLEFPGISPAELWGEFVRQAEDRCGDVFDEFDRELGVLCYRSSSNSDLVTEIKFEAFRRRVSRARKESPSAKAGLDADYSTGHSGHIRHMSHTSSRMYSNR